MGEVCLQWDISWWQIVLICQHAGPTRVYLQPLRGSKYQQYGADCKRWGSTLVCVWRKECVYYVYIYKYMYVCIPLKVKSLCQSAYTPSISFLPSTQCKHNYISISLVAFLASGIACFPPASSLRPYLCQRLERLFQVHHIQVSDQRKRSWPRRQTANRFLQAGKKVKKSDQPCCQIQQQARARVLQQTLYGHV